MPLEAAAASPTRPANRAGRRLAGWARRWKGLARCYTQARAAA